MILQVTAEKTIRSDVSTIEANDYGLGGISEIAGVLDSVLYSTMLLSEGQVGVYTWSDPTADVEYVRFYNWPRFRDWLATAEQDRDRALAQIVLHLDRDLKRGLKLASDFLDLLLTNYKEWNGFVVDNTLTLRFSE